MSSDPSSHQPKSADQALERLKKGNQRFVASQLAHDFQDADRRGQLTGGQWPWAVVLTCADSRVVPELIFDTGIGELFVIRVAGNVANTSSIASIEYAVHVLGVQLVVVLGHESCGAVKAALDGKDLGHNLNHLLAHIKPAIDQPMESADQVTEASERNPISTANQLSQRSPILQGAGPLTILPAIYRLADGNVDYLG